ncbi:hypothetical protein H4219_004068 [Mycoemilia scoparia]|uniref:Uncharacterized protein n=1 Tax=Mycoemilia scoparia TaxID=417184 RepID=A0A9W7ZZF7_9FUNG|nr:hypothetical protein H4219_004068 [Mycoemilia scoparia]
MNRSLSRLSTITKGRLLQRKSSTPVLKGSSVEAIDSKYMTLCSTISHIPLVLCNNNFDENTIYFYSEMLDEMACLLKGAMNSGNSGASSLISRLIEVPFLFLDDARKYFEVAGCNIDNDWFHHHDISGLVGIINTEMKMRDYLCAIMDMQRSVSASSTIFRFFGDYEHTTYSFNSNGEKVGLYSVFIEKATELVDKFRKEIPELAKQCIGHNESLFRERYDQKHQKLHAKIEKLVSDIKELVGDSGQKGRANMPTENSSDNDVRKKNFRRSITQYLTRSSTSSF